jgi:hypothetical protein
VWRTWLCQLTQPVLVVQHQHDQCKVTLYQNVQPVMDGLQSSRSKELLLVDGGVDKGDPCQPWAAHGYNGIESEVVKRWRAGFVSTDWQTEPAPSRRAGLFDQQVSYGWLSYRQRSPCSDRLVADIGSTIFCGDNPADLHRLGCRGISAVGVGDA